jgi:hypothetical protein
MNKEQLLKLKLALERVLEIIKWDPSLTQLEEMAKELNKLPDGAGVREISKVVYAIYKDPIQIWIIKGLDTSKAMETLMRIQLLQEELKFMEYENASTANNQPAKRKD